MRPDRHVARVRRKLPGHHNRRFKGKSREADDRRSRDQSRAELRNTLPPRLAEIMLRLECDTPQSRRRLVDAAMEVLLALGDAKIPSVWLWDDGLYVIYDSVYVTFQESVHGVEADCYDVRAMRSIRLYDRHSTTLWIRRCLENQDGYDDEDMGLS